MATCLPPFDLGDTSAGNFLHFGATGTQASMLFKTGDHGCAGWRGEMSRLIQAYDWSGTELGPVDRWSHSLCTAVRMMLASPVPQVMLWGRPGYMIYNDAYSVFAGGRHPFLLGSPVELGWPEVAEFNRNVVDTCLAGGTLLYQDKELVLLRTGKPEPVWMDLYYSPVPGDDGTPAGVICVVVETTSTVLANQRRQQAEDRYRATNERLQLALSTGAILGSYVWDIPANSVTGDDRFVNTFQLPPDQSGIGLPIRVVTEIVHPDDLERVHGSIDDAVNSGRPYNAEYRIKRPDGHYRWILASGRCEFDDAGQPLRFPGVLIDIHDRKMAEDALLRLTQDLEQRVADAIHNRMLVEEQLRHAQKMESIGALTGGVAHDFNNVLQVISGNLQILAREAGVNPRSQKRIDAASKAVQRGAKLSSQLLAFARRQQLSPSVFSPACVFDALSDLLQGTLGDAITLAFRLPDDLWDIKVDRNQFESAVLNLLINARDAMNRDGEIGVIGDNVVLDARFCDGKEVSPGEYLRLMFTDHGEGMAPEVLERACEPFFTTKAEGQGTGLGLSMVFGFVMQSGGFFDIASEPGKGTCVQMYFPRSTEGRQDVSESPGVASTGGDETILVVEDNPGVRETAKHILEQLGYTVVEAASADDAFATLAAGLHVDLIFTDVVMPGRSKSSDLAAWAKARLPAIPVVFTSGHARDIITANGLLDPDVHMLSKPYAQDTLARLLRKALASGSPRSA